MLPNNFIFSETESLFQQKLDSNEIKNTAIAFMADTGRIWTHGVWFCTALTAEDIQNLIDQSTTLQEFLQSLSPAEVSVSDTQPTGEEKIWINGNTISFNNGGSWSTPINLDNFLSKNNELEYTPVGDYNPATKKYVDDQIVAKDNVLIVDANDFVGSPLNGELVDSLINAAQEGKAIVFKNNEVLIPLVIDVQLASNKLYIHYDIINKHETKKIITLSQATITINTLDNTFTTESNEFELLANGDGLKYLSDDGTYKTFPDMATVVELNASVLALTSASSSEEIIAAFDSTAEFSNLIAQIRDSNNIVNEVLLDTDGYIGHINASLAVSKTDEIIHIRFIDNNDKLVFITVTNNAGIFSCTRTDKDLVNDPVTLVSDGNGNLFLANDGTYKTIEAGDKTNVLILSLENDLANGQKDSPVTAEVSTALKDAISTGKACVIKSANSDILANLQQIGDNVTIIMEQISRVGQTFVAVNTTITVNTATNVISDYQTGAIVLETEGDGSKFLSDDGSYKKINIEPVIINYDDIIEDEIHINNIIETVTNAYNNNKPILLNDTDILMPLTSYNYISNILSISFIRTSLGTTKAYSFEINGNDYLIAKNVEVELANYKDFLTKDNASPFTPTGDYQPATKKYVDDKNIEIPLIDITDYYQNKELTIPQTFLNEIINRIDNKEIIPGKFCAIQFQRNADDYMYAYSVTYNFSKELVQINAFNRNTPEYGTGHTSGNGFVEIILAANSPIKLKYSGDVSERVLTESEYSALGTTPETDDVLYFIIPDA